MDIELFQSLVDGVDDLLLLIWSIILPLYVGIGVTTFIGLDLCNLLEYVSVAKK